MDDYLNSVDDFIGTLGPSEHAGDSAEGEGEEETEETERAGASDEDEEEELARDVFLAFEVEVRAFMLKWEEKHGSW